MSKFLKQCRLVLAIAIISLALLTSLIRALTPWVAQYHTDIENYFSDLLGHKVVIGSMETGWYWFEPVIKLTDLTILNGEEPVIGAHQLLLGINLFSSLWHWKIEPGILYLEKVHLKIYQRDNHWDVEGFNNLKDANAAFNFSSNAQIIALILAQQKLIFKDISAEIALKDGTIIPIKQFNFVISKYFGRYKLKGDIEILQKKPTYLRVLADVFINPPDIQALGGEIYIEGRDFQLAQWQQFIKEHRLQFLDGLINGEVWLSLVKGHITAVQSLLKVKHLDCLDVVTQKHYKADTLHGNWAWHKEKSGWQFSADQLALTLNKKQWPVNELLFSSNESTQTIDGYVKHLWLDSLFAQDIAWPAALKPLIKAKLHGVLQESQLHIKKNKVAYVLSHFSQLGWKPFAKVPGVHNLSGVVHWQPQEGRLELDGHKTSITPRGKPAILFTELNAAMDWKKVASNWQVTLGRFVLLRPDLVATFSGKTAIRDSVFLSAIPLAPTVSYIPSWHPLTVATQPETKTLIQPTIELKGALSATKAHRWMKYLPDNVLKLKLNKWLKHDIKRIDRLVAEVELAGPLADFPFDGDTKSTDEPGVFKIDAHLSGLDLFFAPHWPLTRDIEGYLHFDKRILTADIVYAKLQDIRVDQVNLSVNDLGLDHETLLVHGQVRTTGTKALTYVLASPLAEKLPLLKRFSLDGMLDLDLKLEAPLYPENDTILTQGELTFHRNQIQVNHPLSQIELDNVTGRLPFSQDGVMDSQLKALIFASPMAIEIQSVSAPKSGTRVHISGNLSFDKWKEGTTNPLLKRMQGSTAIDSILTINNDPGDVEQAKFESSLEGLGINLPAPLGKAADLKKPLLVEIGFNKSQEMQVQLKYASFALNATQMVNGNWTVLIDDALIAGKLLYQSSTKKLTAKLSKWYLQADPLLSQEGASQLSALKASAMPNVVLQIQDFRYGDWDLGIVDCQATTAKSSWVIDYCKVSATPYYMQAQGKWVQNGEVNTSTVDLTMSISDLAKTLSRWKITPVVAAKKGDIQVHAEWPGAFQDFSLARVSGLSLIVLKRGEITHLDAATEEKLGLGKLLSIVNLQTIPRRLMLDFSDLSHKGFVFDVFRGHFVIGHGVMSTSDSLIDAPVASASITGSLDIVHQLYDLKIKIAPHLTASLPIVATIAGGPIVGAATWVASKIINQGMQKFSAYGYKITGPWKKPVVKQIDIFKDLDKKLLGIDLL